MNAGVIPTVPNVTNTASNAATALVVDWMGLRLLQATGKPYRDYISGLADNKALQITL